MGDSDLAGVAFDDCGQSSITAAEAATKEVDLVVRTPRNLVMRTPRTDRRKRLIEGTAAKHISALPGQWERLDGLPAADL
jgi:hypothetical protein